MMNPNRSEKDGPHSENAYPEALPGGTRQVFLSVIDFIRERLRPAESGFRTTFEHVSWVRDEIREVLEAYSEENRLEEIGDVVMTSFRLSCFLHPEKNSEEILAVYDHHPTFRRYAHEIGLTGAKAMRKKFVDRYAFLNDDGTYREIFENGEGHRIWQREIVRRTFAAEKSREPNRKHPIPFPTETVPSASSLSELGALGWKSESDEETKTGIWLMERLGEAFRTPEWLSLFRAFEKSGRFRDERFFRMVCLDLGASGDAVGAVVRLTLLAGTAEEAEAALRLAMPDAGPEFVAAFLAERPESDRLARFYYLETRAAFGLFLEAGFSQDEAFEHADGLVTTWRVFGEVRATHDLVAAIAEVRQDERFRNEQDPNRKFVIIQAKIHQIRKREGAYAKRDAFGWKVEETLSAYSTYPANSESR